MAISCHDFRYRVEGNEFFKTKDIVMAFLKENNFEVYTQNSSHEVQDDYVYALNRNL